MSALMGAIAFALAGAAAFLSLRWVERQAGRPSAVSPRTTALLWLAWLAHGALTLSAASQGLAEMPLAAFHSRLFGYAAMAVGGGVLIAAAVSTTSWQQFLGIEPRSIQVRGVYRFSRNPRLAGWGLYLLGAAFVNRSGIALLLVLGYWVWLIAYLRLDERLLARNEGSSRWSSYRDSVPRFFGRTPRGRR
ncbi:putative protein-S-isoprenylcysteine methyltransferase [Salinisphaera sp. PC39]|uniref:methyltransferase family protein n=1 Tax=Salinisphaera sp. PC39 TaxID=1304156 RepID=UPI00333E515E